MQKQFQSKDVIFIGLTDQSAAELPEIKQFLTDTGVTWHNGYGAGETLANFGHAYYPQMWIIGRDGRIAWNQSSGVDLEAGIQAALAAEPAEAL